MKIFFTLAVRNLLRNWRRTGVVLSMVVGAFVAVTVFEGFSEYIIRMLRVAAIDIQYGNMQVAKAAIFEKEATDDARENLIAEPEKLAADLRRIPGVTGVGGRLAVFALAVRGDTSVSARVMAIDPSVEVRMSTHFNFDQGQGLESDSDREIMVASGLNMSLGAKAGDRVTLVVSTYEGTMNAMDVTVKGIFTAGSSQLDDYVIFLPLRAAQKLTDTEGVESLVVLTKDENESAVAAGVKSKANAIGLEMRTWKELAQFFNQVKEFWSVQNTLVGAILGLLILLGIANTVSIAVVERTAEIGTLRAIGFRRSDVVKIFVSEAFVMGAAGSLLAVPTSLLTMLALNFAKIQLVLPGASKPVVIVLDFAPASYLIGASMGVAIPILAALPAVLRIVRMPVVESLRRGI